MEAVQFAAISKRYDSFRLDRVGFSIPEGSIAGLVGQNGAGKSTFIKCALRLVAPESGEMILPGVDPKTLDRIALSRFVGYVPESPSFYEWMTTGRLVRFASHFYPDWDWSYADALMRTYSLDPGKRIKHLSKGMRAKVSLLLALAHRPPVLILDEPTSGLDPVMKAEFLDELQRLVSAGEVKAILISSHVLSEIAHVADKIAVLQAGRLVDYCDRDSMTRGWQKVIFQPPAGQVLRSPVLSGARPSGPGMRMLVMRRDDTNVMDELRSAGASRISVVEPDLEEILLAAVRDGGGQ